MSAVALRGPTLRRAETAASALSRRRALRGADLSRLVPSGRSVAVGLALVAVAAGVYLLARESSLFALRTIEVRGAPPAVAARVRKALDAFIGDSLVTLDQAAVGRRLSELPVVASARYDRDFPHTLRVFVRPEQPVAVLRRGAESWLVSARARVMARVALGSSGRLPRIWAPTSVSVVLGETLGGDPARAVEAVVPLAGTPFDRRVASARAAPNELTLVLRSGLELRLGNSSNLRLKLAIGRRIATALGPGRGYVDLTVPGRPVASSQP